MLPLPSSGTGLPHPGGGGGQAHHRDHRAASRNAALYVAVKGGVQLSRHVRGTLPPIVISKFWGRSPPLRRRPGAATTPLRCRRRARPALAGRYGADAVWRWGGTCGASRLSRLLPQRPRASAFSQQRPPRGTAWPGALRGRR